MNTIPRMLKAETGWVERTHRYFPSDEFIDYRVYEKVPRWWRRIEEWLRLDIYLALRVKRLSSQYDIIWANSEKVGIPLSFLKIRKPLVVILQFPESPLRAWLMKITGIAKKWAGVGIVAREARHFLQSALGVDPAKIFQYYAARTDIFKPAPDGEAAGDGSILSMGVAKRDYDTMIEALADLPGCQTKIFISSKYGDQYRGRRIAEVPGWIQFPERVSDQELACLYQTARFVVVPLIPTSHSGAGVTSVFEASASGKAVIATNTGGMNSFIVHGKTGLLVPPRDVAALREAIRTLWENQELAQQLGKAGRKFVEENYDHEQVIAGITAFLTRLWDELNKTKTPG